MKVLTDGPYLKASLVHIHLSSSLLTWQACNTNKPWQACYMYDVMKAALALREAEASIHCNPGLLPKQRRLNEKGFERPLWCREERSPGLPDSTLNTARPQIEIALRQRCSFATTAFVPSKIVQAQTL